MSNAGETIVWSGNPSHAKYALTYTALAAAAAAVIVLAVWIMSAKLPPNTLWAKGAAGYGATLVVGVLFIWALVQAITRKLTLYEITTERIRVTAGLIGREIREIELYNVRDITLVQPALYRLFNVGNVVINSGDGRSGEAELVLEALPNAVELLRTIRSYKEERRGFPPAARR